MGVEAEDERRRERIGLAVLLTAYLAIHLLLLGLVDTGRPDAFLMGDRSHGRLLAVQELVEFRSSGQALTVLSLRGNPGDYAFHALFWAMGGRIGVILVQIALGVVGLAALYYLARLVLGSMEAALLTGVLYLLLPGTLLHPHVIATEGLFTPLLIGHVALLAGALLGAPPSRGRLVAAGVLAGVAAAIRPVFILFPILEASLLVVHRARPPRQILAFTALALALGLAWPVLHSVRLASPGWGGTNTLSSNLHGRAQRMADLETLGLPEREVERRWLGPAELSPGAFARIVVQHPKAFLRTVLTDFSNLAVNSGLNAFAGRYLDLYPMSRDTRRFTETVDRLGSPWAALRDLARTTPVVFPLNAAAGLMWLGFTATSLAGLILLLRSRDLPSAIPWTLLLLAIYVVTTAFAATGVRWSHRFPVEFVMALATAGTMAAAWEWVRKRSTTPDAPD
jgi:hypothetical protein